MCGNHFLLCCKRRQRRSLGFRVTPPIVSLIYSFNIANTKEGYVRL